MSSFWWGWGCERRSVASNCFCMSTSLRGAREKGRNLTLSDVKSILGPRVHGQAGTVRDPLHPSSVSRSYIVCSGSQVLLDAPLSSPILSIHIHLNTSMLRSCLVRSGSSDYLPSLNAARSLFFSLCTPFHFRCFPRLLFLRPAAINHLWRKKTAHASTYISQGIQPASQSQFCVCSLVLSNTRRSARVHTHTNVSFFN